jgi:hypothetical protein
VALDCLKVLQETMWHFYQKAKILASLGENADFEAIDAAMVQAAHWATQIAGYKYPKLQAIKVNVADREPLTIDSMTREQLRDSIMADFERLHAAGYLPPAAEPNKGRADRGGR